MLRRLLPLALLALLSLAPASVLARAGGGQSYSGGGGHSSSSSSSFSSGGGSHGGGRPLFEPDSPVAVAAGWACFAFFIAAMGGLVWLAFSVSPSTATQKAIARHEAQRKKAPPIDGPLAEIRARDAKFAADDFLDGMEKAFLELQEAWSRGDFEKARRFMSDGLYRRFTTQLALNAHFGKRNVVRDVTVMSKKIAAVETDRDFDTIHVAFVAMLRDFDAPATLTVDEALFQAQRAPETDFLEFWSFVRRPDAEGNGLLARGSCPSCGAPVELKDGNCAHCGAVMNSGAFDWVLAEITQESEFDHRLPPVPEGFAQAREKEPGLNRQVLEDRASLVFWKYVALLAGVDAEGFAPFSAPGRFRDFDALAKKERFEQTAVGAVELIAFESAVEGGTDGDRAHFLVKWSTSGAGTGLVRTNVLTLRRDPKARTFVKSGLSTERCHACGGPQTKRGVDCEYCGAALTDGWCLERVWRPEEFAAAHPSKAPASALAFEPRERQRALTAMVAVARADGEVSPPERRLLESCAQRWSVPSELVDGLLNLPPADLAGLAPTSPEEGAAFYGALAAAAYVDGRLDREERRLLDAMAAHLKLAGEAAEAAEREAEKQAAALRIS